MSRAGAVLRSDWRETLRAFSDFAIVGFLVVLAALPVVTAGSAVAAGSAAVHHWCEHDRLPSIASAWRWFVRGLLPGLGALLAAVVVAALLAGNVAAIRSGTVPGGSLAVGLTVLVAAVLAGLAGMVVVRLGQNPSDGWLRAVRGTFPGPHTPHGWPAVAAATGVLALATVLVTALPVTIPLVAGFTLLALHAVTRRLTRA